MSEQEQLHCFVEIPKGSRNKYEWDEELQAIKLNRFLFSSVQFPTDYGFVTETLGNSGDARAPSCAAVRRGASRCAG